MTTLETEAGTSNANKQQTTRPESTPASAVEKPTDTAPLNTEQQVHFASAAALAPARHRNVVGKFASAVRAMFTHEAKPREHKHYPQRFTYLENSAMSREMIRL